MPSARFVVRAAGPLVTFQDSGRTGQLRFGVSPSGPMDRLAFDAAHTALGNPNGGTAIEVSLGGLTLCCRSGDVTVAVTGGGCLLEHNDQQVQGWTILTLRGGDTLRIRPGKSGSWAYVAFAGHIESKRWLGSAATHAGSDFGGGALVQGQDICITAAAVRDDRVGEIAKPAHAPLAPLRVVMGPQEQYFEADAARRLTGGTFRVSDAYDRMGMRIEGPRLPLLGALSIPSEPVVKGAIQVSGDGVPSILLADHQTTGGYPKIATVISADIDRLVQLRSGQTLRFAAISPEESIAAVRAEAKQRSQYLDRLREPRGTLAQRLMRENLNHGAYFD